MRCLQHDKFVVMVVFIKAIVDKKFCVNLQNQREEKRSFFLQHLRHFEFFQCNAMELKKYREVLILIECFSLTIKKSIITTGVLDILFNLFLHLPHSKTVETSNRQLF